MSWKIDTAHSEIFFSVRHMMISKVRGEFEKFDGQIDFDQENPKNTTVDVQIEAASINTNEAQRDEHLKSADFFDVENYPVLRFKSRHVELTGNNTVRLVGDLTIRDITREVTLDVEFSGSMTNPWGKTVAGFSAHTTINRKEWNLNWNVALEAGGWLVGEEIDISVGLELIKQELPETALA